MRKMTEGDRTAVVGLMREFYGSAATLTNGSEEIFNADVTACVSDSPFADGYVFEDDSGNACGYAIIAHSFSTEFGRPCIWVEDIYLAPELRGRGLGPAFLDHIACEYPDSVIRLESEHDNIHAMEVYRGRGFKEFPYVEMIKTPDGGSGSETL